MQLNGGGEMHLPLCASFCGNTREHNEQQSILRVNVLSPLVRL